MYCIIVKAELKPGTRENFLAAMLPNAESSVQKETGCLVFDVIEDREAPNTFYLYEIFKDERALAAQKETTHYRESRAVVNELIAQQSVIRTNVVAMSPARS